MRTGLLVATMALSGCIYVSGINHGPEATLELDQASSQLELAGRAVLKATTADEDGDELLLSWRIKVVAQRNGKTYFFDQLPVAGKDQQQDLAAAEQDNTGVLSRKAADADIRTARDVFSGEKLVLAPLPERGTYTVHLTVRDSGNAVRELTRTFVVANQAPSGVTIHLEVDPDHAHDDRVPDFVAAGESRYPVHAHYQLRVSATDHEGDLRCGGAGTVTWTLTGLQGAKLDYWTPRACQGKQLLGRLRFRLKPQPVTMPIKLSVEAEVSDGKPGTKPVVKRADFSLVPNRPPCIGGSSPSLQTRQVGVPFHQGWSFRVTNPSDDVGPLDQLSYSWQVRRGGSGPFVDLVAGVNGATYTMPGWYGTPGEQLELRVVVQEPGGALPQCAAGDPLCGGPALPDKCYRWVTWKVRFY